jgi:signal transduction histidine kinase
MGNLIDDLLTRARLAAGVEQLNLQWVRLDQLVADVVANTPAHGGDVTLSTVDSTVSADPTLLQRAVGNLLDNALRHGRMPGRHAVVAVSVADGRVTVADQGPGLRGPLKTTPFNQAGSGTTGLGLSIVRWIATAHGGSLHVHNAPGGGAVFELTLRTNQR